MSFYFRKCFKFKPLIAGVVGVRHKFHDDASYWCEGDDLVCEFGSNLCEVEALAYDRNNERPFMSEQEFFKQKMHGSCGLITVEELRNYASFGISVAVKVNGKDVFSKGYGVRDVENCMKATKDMRGNIASITKVWTALVMMRMFEMDKFGFDKATQTFFIDTPIAKDFLNADDAHEVSLDALMQHTCGLRHYAFHETVSYNSWDGQPLQNVFRHYYKFNGPYKTNLIFLRKWFDADLTNDDDDDEEGANPPAPGRLPSSNQSSSSSCQSLGPSPTQSGDPISSQSPSPRPIQSGGPCGNPNSSSSSLSPFPDDTNGGIRPIGSLGRPPNQSPSGSSGSGDHDQEDGCGTDEHESTEYFNVDEEDSCGTEEHESTEHFSVDQVYHCEDDDKDDGDKCEDGDWGAGPPECYGSCDVLDSMGDDDDGRSAGDDDDDDVDVEGPCSGGVEPGYSNTGNRPGYSGSRPGSSNSGNRPGYSGSRPGSSNRRPGSSNSGSRPGSNNIRPGSSNSGNIPGSSNSGNVPGSSNCNGGSTPNPDGSGEPSTSSDSNFVNEPYGEEYTSFGFDMVGVKLETLQVRTLYDILTEALHLLHYQSTALDVFKDLKFDIARGYDKGNDFECDMGEHDRYLADIRDEEGWGHLNDIDYDTDSWLPGKCLQIISPRIRSDYSDRFASQGLIASVADLIKFGDMFLRMDQNLSDGKPLSESIVKQMWLFDEDMVKRNNGSRCVVWSTALGLAWNLRTELNKKHPQDVDSDPEVDSDSDADQRKQDHTKPSSSSESDSNCSGCINSKYYKSPKETIAKYVPGTDKRYYLTQVFKHGCTLGFSSFIAITSMQEKDYLSPRRTSDFDGRVWSTVPAPYPQKRYNNYIHKYVKQNRECRLDEIDGAKGIVVALISNFKIFDAQKGSRHLSDRLTNLFVPDIDPNSVNNQ